MRLTWKDGLTGAFVLAIGLLYYAYSTGADVAIVNDTRGALVVIGAAGLGMCIVAGSSGLVGRNMYSGIMSILGTAAFVLIVIGLITAAAWTVTWLTIDIVVMFGLALAFRLVLVPRRGPTHA